jgi:hypothetical protein
VRNIQGNSSNDAIPAADSHFEYGFGVRNKSRHGKATSGSSDSFKVSAKAVRNASEGRETGSEDEKIREISSSANTNYAAKKYGLDEKSTKNPTSEKLLKVDAE